MAPEEGRESREAGLLDSGSAVESRVEACMSCSARASPASRHCPQPYALHEVVSEIFNFLFGRFEE